MVTYRTNSAPFKTFFFLDVTWNLKGTKSEVEMCPTFCCSPTCLLRRNFPATSNSEDGLRSFSSSCVMHARSLRDCHWLSWDEKSLTNADNGPWWQRLFVVRTRESLCSQTTAALCGEALANRRRQCQQLGCHPRTNLNPHMDWSQQGATWPSHCMV